MALRRTLRSALPGFLLAVLIGLVLSSCGSPANPGPAPSPTSASAGQSSPPPTPDPRPTPASSTGPARNQPKPVLPDAAKQNTKEGFAAFTQYWFDTVTYGLETGDSGPLKEISLPDCKMCNGYLSEAENVSGGAGWHVGPRWKVSGFTSDMSVDPAGQALGYFFLEESPSEDYLPTGERKERLEPEADKHPKTIYALHRKGRWFAAQAGQA